MLSPEHYSVQYVSYVTVLILRLHAGYYMLTCFLHSPEETGGTPGCGTVVLAAKHIYPSSRTAVQPVAMLDAHTVV